MLDMKAILYVYTILLSLNIFSIQSGSVLPIDRLTNPSYFSAYYFSFTNSPSFSSFNPTTYVHYYLTCPLNRTMNNITSTWSLLSSFDCANDYYFGIQTSTTYVNNPSTVITIDITVGLSQFISLGFSVIIVTKPFQNIIYFREYQMVTSGKLYFQYFTTTSTYYIYLKSVDMYKSTAGYYGLSSDQFTLIRYSNGFGITFANDPATIVARFTCLCVFVNNGLLSSTLQYTFIKYNAYSRRNVFGYINFGVDTLTYETDFNKYCIIGFDGKMENINTQSPYFRFDMNSSGIFNGDQNSISNNNMYRIVCFKDLQCPSSHPFRTLLKKTFCFDCPSDGIILPTGTPYTNQTSGRCLAYDPTIIMDQFDPTNGGSINQCYSKCIDCNEYYYANGTCQLCNRFFTNCLTCNQNIGCLTCISMGSVLIKQTCILCTFLFLNCSICNSTDCITCDLSYFWFQGRCLTLAQIKIVGCQALKNISASVVCLLCDKAQKFVLNNVTGRCVCISGFYINNNTKKCDEVCGDGVAYLLQCDDGNNNDDDGCTNQCTISSGFQCIVTNGTTFCKTYYPLQLKIAKIAKDSGKNSGLMTLEATGSIFPYDFLTSEFNTSNTNLSSIQIKMIISSNPLILEPLSCYLISASTNMIELHIQYNFTIQLRPCIIYIITSGTRYIVPDDRITLYTTLRGTNYPLIVSGMADQSKAIAMVLEIVNFLALLCMLIGLFSQKYIGLECVITLQLIYYSQLLLDNSNKWTPGLQYLKYLKYSSGYNQLFSLLTDYYPKTSIQRKMYYLTISKTILQNYNLSFIILVSCFIIFLLTMNLRLRISNKIKNDKQKLFLQWQQKQQQFRYDQQQSTQFIEDKRNLKIKQYLELLAYRMITQISKWSILQILSAVSASFIISNATIMYQGNNFSSIPAKLKSIIDSVFLIKLSQKIIVLSALGIIIWIGLSNKNNFLISARTNARLAKRPQQIRYKQVTFYYLILIGLMMCLYNQKGITIIPMSFIILLMQISYTIVIHHKIQPYKNSLKLHRYTLLFTHIIFLIFLIYINLINIVSPLNEFLQICFSYLITGCLCLMVLLTIIRLYYQYRFGEELELEIQKEEKIRGIQIQKQEEQRMYQEKVKLHKNHYQQQANKSQDIKDNQLRNQNHFLVHNQIDQQKKQQLFFWLSQRFHWTKQEKQKYYYQRFSQKPLEWLKKHNKKRYNEIIQKRQKHSKQQRKIKQEKKAQDQVQYDKSVLKQLKKKMLGQNKPKSKSKTNKKLILDTKQNNNNNSI